VKVGDFAMLFDLECLAPDFSVCQLPADANIPDWANKGEFWAITRSSDELSIVCESQFVPKDVRAEQQWRALKVLGPLDFAMVGVLAALSATLAEAGVSIFAISTFDTDFLLVKLDRLDDAISALSKVGHKVAAV